MHPSLRRLAATAALSGSLLLTAGLTAAGAQAAPANVQPKPTAPHCTPTGTETVCTPDPVLTELKISPPHQHPVNIDGFTDDGGRTWIPAKFADDDQDRSIAWYGNDGAFLPVSADTKVGPAVPPVPPKPPVPNSPHCTPTGERTVCTPKPVFVRLTVSFVDGKDNPFTTNGFTDDQGRTWISAYNVEYISGSPVDPTIAYHDYDFTYQPLPIGTPVAPAGPPAPPKPGPEHSAHPHCTPTGTETTCSPKPTFSRLTAILNGKLYTFQAFTDDGGRTWTDADEVERLTGTPQDRSVAWHSPYSSYLPLPEGTPVAPAA